MVFRFSSNFDGMIRLWLFIGEFGLRLRRILRYTVNRFLNEENPSQNTNPRGMFILQFPRQLTISFWIFKILSFASSTFSFFPVIVIVSLFSTSEGKSIFVFVSSRIYTKFRTNYQKVLQPNILQYQRHNTFLILAPARPIINL